MEDLNKQFVRKDDFDKLQKDFDDLKYLFYKNNFPYRQIFDKDIVFKKKVTFDNTELGFFSVTPIAQKDHISDPSGGTTTDSQARTAIGSILVVLESFGLIKTS